MKKLALLMLACCWLTLQACGSSTDSPSDGAIEDDAGLDGQGDSELDAGEDPDGTDGGSGDLADRDHDGGDLDDEDGSTLDGDGDQLAQDGGDPVEPDGGDQGEPDGGDPIEPDGGDPIEPDGGDGGPLTFTAVTFNTGIHPTVGQNGWTLQMNQDLDTYYGHGLCWGPAIDQARAFLDTVQPDIIVFQEIFDIEQCADIPLEAQAGFVCENWVPGSPTVEELILGPGYQVACNFEKSDKCAAVKTSFGTFNGCAQDICYDGLDGYRVPDCGSGSRIGRGLIELSGGGTITLVNVHGSSGLSGDDMDCRVKQVDQVFVDLGDGEPGANGLRNLVLGDFNTDPRSATAIIFDESARRWTDFVGADKAFDYLNDRVLTYSGIYCIDNVVSDVLTGTCWYPGFTDGHPEVSPEGLFDHVPTVCEIALP